MMSSPDRIVDGSPDPNPQATSPPLSLSVTPATGMPCTAVPLFAHAVQAGFPSPADDYIAQTLDLNAHLMPRPAASFLLRAKGESMIGVGIHDGDLLVVDRSLRAQHGSIVIAAVDGQFTVKRLEMTQPTPSKRKAGSKTTNELPQEGASEPGIPVAVRLVAANPDFPVIELQDAQELQLFGVVTHVIHDLR